MTDINVDALLKAQVGTSTKALCYKLVDVFAGVCDRKLYLKNAADKQPKTNGYLIEVPFKHPRAYQYTEHEISHILFQSDFLARQGFVQEYARKVSQIAKQEGAPINERTLRAGLDAIISVLDEERVISLWGLLYRGSEAIMRRMKYDEATPHIDKAHQGLISVFLCVASGHEIPDGKLSRFIPYMNEGLRKVRYRDYFGCLVTAKWLVVQLVSEMIRESRGELPPAAPAPQLGTGSEGMFGGQGTVGGSDAFSEPDEVESPPDMPWEQSDVPEASDTTTDGGNEVWEPPEVTASGHLRAKALQRVVEGMTNAPKKVTEELTESKYKRRGEQAAADQQARSALAADVKNTGKLEDALEASSGQMKHIVDKARQACKNTPNHDDSIRRDAYAKVIFADVLPSPHRDPHATLSQKDDAETVRRLRAIFHRVIGRRVNRLEEVGSQIDIPALIERRMTHEPLPVFRMDTFGRGFKTVIIVDRSSSMKGRRTAQAERACRIISKALDFPFVDRQVWGFQSLKEGEVNITRFKPGQEMFESDAAMVGGITPLHTAVRVGVRELEEGTDRKHLFVVSDGYPVYARADGNYFGTKTLMGFVRSNVFEARQKGVGVTGVLIGRDMGAKSMAFMFGSSKYWRILSEKRFTHDLVELISSAFISYLRSR